MIGADGRTYRRKVDEMKHGQRSPGEVNVQVKGKNLTVTPALEAHVVEKMRCLDKYLDRLSNIEVELECEQTRDAAHHNHVEATARVAGRTIRVTTSHSDMYAAIDEVVDKLYRQLNRQKERMKSHHAPKPMEALAIAQDGPGSMEPESDELTGTIVRVKRFDMKPEFEDDAVENLEDLGHNFYVFLNAQSEQVNVLYKRRDGSYGLIQPLVGG